MTDTRHIRRRLVALAALVAVAAGVAVAVVGGSGGVAPAHSPGAGAVAAAASRGFPVRPSFAHQPRAALLVDLDSGRVLWALHAGEVLPIASLTKMMTALLVVRASHPGDQVRVTKEALAYQGSGMGVLPRDRNVRLETLLAGLLLPSGNDAAIALAQHVAGTPRAFVARMNAQAAKLGLRCTHYTSVDGFDNGNRSCAEDLAALAKMDLAQPRIAALTRQAHVIAPLPVKGGKVYLNNNNRLVLRRYPGITGLKTGETVAAGLCIVDTAQRGGRRLAVVILHAKTSRILNGEAQALLDAGFRVER